MVETADLNPDVIDASDAIFSAGGDGIFLMAANKVVDRNKPVIGVNTGNCRTGENSQPHLIRVGEKNPKEPKGFLLKSFIPTPFMSLAIMQGLTGFFDGIPRSYPQRGTSMPAQALYEHFGPWDRQADDGELPLADEKENPALDDQTEGRALSRPDHAQRPNSRFF